MTTEGMTNTKRNALLRDAIAAVEAARAKVLLLRKHDEQHAAGSGLMARVTPLAELLVARGLLCAAA